MTLPTSSLPLYPPFRYGMVEGDMFRGAYPKERNYAFLARLRLRTVLSLTPEPANPSLSAFCAANNITPIHVRVDKPKDHIPLSFSKTAQILSVLIDPANHPLFVHCLDGASVTTAAVMCLRRLQCWTMAPILAESTRYHKEGIIGSEEAEFVEKFNAEVEIGVRLPNWLWGGTMGFKKHPNLRIKVPQAAMKASGSPMPGHESGGNGLGPPYATAGDISALLNSSDAQNSSSSNTHFPGGEDAILTTDGMQARRSFDASVLLHTPSPHVVLTAPKDVASPAGLNPSSNNASKNDLRREKEDLRRRVVTENLLGMDVGGRSSDGQDGSSRGDSLGMDDDVEDSMSMTLQALALEMSSPFTKNPK